MMEGWALGAWQGGRGRGARILGAALVGLAVMSGCHDPPAGLVDSEPIWEIADCNLDPAYVKNSGIGLDGLPALTDPPFTTTNPQSSTSYVGNEDRVIGIVLEGQAMAIPLGALWYHEMLNLSQGGSRIVVTHGTFTGSSRVYTRTAVGGMTFGVTGFLYRNNTLQYDHSTSPSLWDQMTGEARCGPRLGTKLSTVRFLEVTYGGWKDLHPNTLVLSDVEAINNDWGVYPYGEYEVAMSFFYPDAMPALDGRRHPKERVLGIAGEAEAIAFPFGAMADMGPVGVARGILDGEGMVVFWRSDYEGAAAYWLTGAAQDLSFSVQDGEIVDNETGTTWSFLGVGTGGGSDGVTLEPVSQAVVSYWGAWAAFFPDTELWSEDDLG